MALPTPRGNAALEQAGVRAEHIVAHQLAASAQAPAQGLPALDIVLGHAVLDGDDGVVLHQLRQVVHLLLAAAHQALARVAVAVLAMEFAGGRVQRLVRAVQGGRKAAHVDAVALSAWRSVWKTSAREMRHEGADLIIAWDLSTYAEADRRRAIELAPVHFGAVCTPAYARRRPANRARIAHEYTASAWNQWEALTGQPVALGETLAFPHTHLCIEAALSGLGVALVEQRLIARELQEGLLVAPHGFVPFEGGLRAVPAAGRALPAQAGVFIEWMRNALAS